MYGKNAAVNIVLTNEGPISKYQYYSKSLYCPFKGMYYSKVSPDSLKFAHDNKITIAVLKKDWTKSDVICSLTFYDKKWYPILFIKISLKFLAIIFIIEITIGMINFRASIYLISY
jgi:hypothetical protein